MWREARRKPKPSDTFYNLSNSFFIILWRLFIPRVPECRSSLFGAHKWRFEFKIAQDLARVFSVWGPSCLSWMDLGASPFFPPYMLWDGHFQTFSLMNILSAKMPALHLSVWIFLSHTPDTCLPNSCIKWDKSSLSYFLLDNNFLTDHCFSPPMCLLDAPQGQV